MKRNAARILFATLLALFSACQGLGKNAFTHEIRTEVVDYRAGDTELRGYLAYPVDASADKPVPGVLVVHEWWGHNDYARRRAEKLASMGYAAFALDMFGAGKLAAHPEDAMAFAEEATSDEERMVARFNAAHSVLNQKAFVNSQKTAAIGYCMGGGVVLNMVRLGADLDLVASFHGSLPTSGEFKAGKRQTAILVYSGQDDPFVPEEKVEEFQEFFRHPSICKLRLVLYKGVLHSFTNPEATATGEKFGLPLKYDANADERSWANFTEALSKI